MNLVTNPWLPVINKNNLPKSISLNQLFEQPDEWIDLVLRPHERVSVMRFLICLTQSALDGPADSDDWDDTIGLVPEAALAYLKKWGDSFDLYHVKKPFLQIPDLEPANKEPATLDKLDFALATGSNSTLFDHQAIDATNNRPNRELTDDRIVISMLAFNNFSLGGLYPQAKWRTKTTSKTGVKDSPCASQSMLHCYVRKSTLVETIHANLLTTEQIVERYGVDGIGKPVWEMFPFSPEDDKAIKNATTTYLGRLVPLSRWLKLLPDQNALFIGEGFVYPVFPNFIEATTAQIKNYKGELAIISGKSKAPWRELNALSLKRKVGDQIGGPAALENIIVGQEYDLMVLCLKRQDASVLDTLESVLRVPSVFTMIQTSAQNTYKDEISFTEKKALILKAAIRKYLAYLRNDLNQIVNKKERNENLKKDEGKKFRALNEKVEQKYISHFWTLIEKQRHLLMQYIELLGTELDTEREEAKDKWRKAIHSAVNETYQTLCSQNSPRQVRAYVAGWAVLYPQSKSSKEKV